MAQMGFTFETIAPPPIDEASFIDAGDLAASLKKLAKAKADAVAADRSGALVLGADTVVVQGDNVLGKPKNRDEARTMLSALSNTRHTVMTGVALVCRERSFSAAAVACTDVFFRSNTIDEIEAYLEQDEYRDKAGAYAIQGRGMMFVDKINGCYYNVVGLPVSETIGVFTAFVRLQG
jgi:septum formation protein